MEIANENSQKDYFKDNYNSLLSFDETGYSKQDFTVESISNKDILLPINIFNNDSLSALETISKYLKEELNLKYCEIASLLNRDDRTIWGAYDSAKRKMEVRLTEEIKTLYIPLSIFRNRSLSTLEVLTMYLREVLNLKYCQIAPLLNRNDRTIWTVYQRVRRKKIKNGNLC